MVYTTVLYYNNIKFMAITIRRKMRIILLCVDWVLPQSRPVAAFFFLDFGFKTNSN